MMLAEERWRPVPFPGFDQYLVSDCGRVRRDPPFFVSRPHLKPAHFRHGYPGVVLVSRERKRWSVYVHRLVAAAFLGPRPTGLHVNHIDGCKQNNRVSNLEYVTPTANQEHATAHGLHPFGSANGNSRLNAVSVAAIRAERAAGASLRAVAARHGVTYGHVSRICRNVSWKAAV